MVESKKHESYSEQGTKQSSEVERKNQVRESVMGKMRMGIRCREMERAETENGNQCEMCLFI